MGDKILKDTLLAKFHPLATLYNLSSEHTLIEQIVRNHLFYLLGFPY